MSTGGFEDVFYYGEELQNGTFNRDLIRDYIPGEDVILVTSNWYTIQTVGSTTLMIFANPETDAIYMPFVSDPSFVDVVLCEWYVDL